MVEKLLNYQIPHFFQLAEAINNTHFVLDASDTGTGKTYVAIALAKYFNLKPFIICPKSVISNWKNVANLFDIPLLGVANYEMIKNCRYYIQEQNDRTKLEKTACPYMDITFDEDKNKTYVFGLPQDTLVIFDEAHRCKNHKSITSKLLLNMRYYVKCPVLLLSATITDKINCFKPFGVVFGFYKKGRDFKSWIKRTMKEEQRIQPRDINDNTMAKFIHDKIFPLKGSRMKIKELGDMFPSNQVISQSYFSENSEVIQEQYIIIKEAFEDLRDKEMRSMALGKIIRARMKIEMYKVQIMVDVIQEALDSNYSVVIFVNYVGTMFKLAEYFKTTCLIHGKQTLEERENAIDRFQANQSEIIISIIQAGGVGISLHDIHGGHPRMSIISPTWSGQDLQQALGRIHRAGSQSPAMQRIIYCAETYEEQICKLVENKLKNISIINDGDLIGELFQEEKFIEVIQDHERRFISDGDDNIDNKNEDDELNELMNNLNLENSDNSSISGRSGDSDC